MIKFFSGCLDRYVFDFYRPPSILVDTGVTSAAFENGKLKLFSCVKQNVPVVSIIAIPLGFVFTGTAIDLTSFTIGVEAITGGLQ